MKAPLFDPGYYPSLESAAPDQILFYKWLKAQLAEGKTPSVDDQTAYVFIVVYELINEFETSKDYSHLATQFDLLRSAYGATKIGRYLNFWQRDAALLAANYEDAWRYSDHLDFNFVRQVRARCADTSISGSAVLRLGSPRKFLTKIGIDNLNLVINELDGILARMERRDGTNFIDVFCDKYEGRPLELNEAEEFADEIDLMVDLELLIADSRRTTNAPFVVDHTHPVFGGVPGLEPRTINFDRPVSPFSERALTGLTRWLFRQAENRVREILSLPTVGGGWVSETLLFNKLKEEFHTSIVIQHGRPLWLRPQHVDIYFPEHKIAVEYQGEQHSRPVQMFGGEEAFEIQLERDERKRRICQANDCSLVEVEPNYQLHEVISQIRELMR